MSNFMNNVKTINSAVRTVLMLGICGGLGYGGYYGYTNYVQPSQDAKRAVAKLAALQQDMQVQAEELAQSQAQLKQANVLNERLTTSLKLLKVDRRLANIKVISKGADDADNPTMDVSFSEVDQDGQEIGSPRIYTLKGEKFYVDGWVVAFEDKYVQQADELRGASLFVFKSIYGDAEAPKDAQSLDVETNGRPGIYQDDRQSDFEKQIWSDFWRVSNDAHRQQELGIRAVHGQSSYIRGKVGKTYQIELRASGSTSLKIVNEP